MTWVILGHNFLFSSFYLHHRNYDYSNKVRDSHEAGLAFEPIKQGDFSVDTFLFIGATLLSYLLLRDLDRADLTEEARRGCCCST